MSTLVTTQLNSTQPDLPPWKHTVLQLCQGNRNGLSSRIRRSSSRSRHRGGGGGGVELSCTSHSVPTVGQRGLFYISLCAPPDPPLCTCKQVQHTRERSKPSLSGHLSLSTPGTVGRVLYAGPHFGAARGRERGSEGARAAGVSVESSFPRVHGLSRPLCAAPRR